MERGLHHSAGATRQAPRRVMDAEPRAHGVPSTSHAPVSVVCDGVRAIGRNGEGSRDHERAPADDDRPGLPGTWSEDE